MLFIYQLFHSFTPGMQKNIIHTDELKAINKAMGEGYFIVCSAYNAFGYEFCAIHVIVSLQVKIHIKHEPFGIMMPHRFQQAAFFY